MQLKIIELKINLSYKIFYMIGNTKINRVKDKMNLLYKNIFIQ